MQAYMKYLQVIIQMYISYYLSELMQRQLTRVCTEEKVCGISCVCC